MKVIKRNYKKIHEEMLKIDKNFIIMFFTSIYNINKLKNDFKDFLSIEINAQNYIQIMSEIVKNIYFKKNDWEKMLNKAIVYNKQYIENFGYDKLSEEKIKRTFEKEMVPSLHYIGANPHMLIMYCFGNNIFQGEKLEFYKKCYENYKNELEKIKNTKMSNLKTNINQSFNDFELEMFSDEEDIDINNSVIEEMKKKFNCNYDETTKTYSNVKRSFLFLLYSKIRDFENFKETILTELNVIDLIIKKINIFTMQQGMFVKELFVLRNENNSLKTKIKKLSKEFNNLEKTVQVLKNKTQSDKDKQILELNKQNNFLQARIEKLENQISLLEEAKQINETIQENVEIKEKVIEVAKQSFDFQEICVLGGNWNSTEKEKLQKVLPTCDIEFIEAERTLAKIDRISNADIIVFDTSRNAHAYYYKVKQFAKKVLHINKSKAEAVMELGINNDLQNSF